MWGKERFTTPICLRNSDERERRPPEYEIHYFANQKHFDVLKTICYYTWVPSADNQYLYLFLNMLEYCWNLHPNTAQLARVQYESEPGLMCLWSWPVPNWHRARHDTPGLRVIPRPPALQSDVMRQWDVFWAIHELTSFEWLWSAWSAIRRIQSYHEGRNTGEGTLSLQW